MIEILKDSTPTDQERSKELFASSKCFVEQSQPGVPQNNAVAERLVQDVLYGTRTALVRAGLPPCFLGVCLPTLLSGREFPAKETVGRS